MLLISAFGGLDVLKSFNYWFIFRNKTSLYFYLWALHKTDPNCVFVHNRKEAALTPSPQTLLLNSSTSPK